MIAVRVELPPDLYLKYQSGDTNRLLNQTIHN